MTASKCLHCASPIPVGANGAFCCAGCEAVHGLLIAQDLGAYYRLAGSAVVPATVEADRSLVWLEPLLSRAVSQAGSLKTLELDVQGIHCAACVWLFNETFQRAGGAAITVNPALGRVRLCWDPQRLALTDWVRNVEAFGYALGPARKQTQSAANALPLRLGICAAITLNVMLFSVSFYFGLAPADGEIFALFAWLSAAFSTAVVLIGGWPFFRSAWRGVRAGVLHLDLPIALGILLVWGASLAQAGGTTTYFDTLNVFITLMLLGRWLQQRVLDRNRRFLLEDDGAQGLFVRRRAGLHVEVVPAPRVRAGDALLIAPGDLVPVDARVDAAVALSTEWINGESIPRAVAAGGIAGAGSFNAMRTAFMATAETDFEQSPLVSLLRQPSPGPAHVPDHLRFWDHLARRWVLQVMIAAAAGFFLWLPSGTHRAIEVATALLVVTCPCAIGIALPLAYELVQARLRRAGLYIRSADLLDRLTRVDTVVFDKTGTLTLGRLQLGNPDSVAALDGLQTEVLWNLCVRSSHPVSVALAEALRPHAPAFVPSAAVVETPGEGLCWVRPDGTWRLGRDGFTHEGIVCAAFELREVLRPAAAEQVRALSASGRALYLLSGDTPAKVRAFGERLGFPAGHAEGGLSPDDKADRVRALGSAVLYLGDGVNDAKAFAAALCAGTPAIERPVMPSRSDFFLVGAGLAPLMQALDAAAHLRTVVGRILALSLGYNAVAIAIALAGWMSPVKAAIFMPVSSLSLLLITGVSLKPRGREAVPTFEPIEARG